jgi:hypothetical protein
MPHGLPTVPFIPDPSWWDTIPDGSLDLTI